MLFLSSVDFFQNHFFRKIISEIPSECQTDLIQIRCDVLSGLIWIQSVCKGYEQTTLVDNELTFVIIHVGIIINWNISSYAPNDSSV